MNGERICTGCGEAKDVGQFSVWQPARCRNCVNSARRQRYASGTSGADKSYDQLLRREYGITLEQYQELARQQGNRCAICRRPETVRYKTGRVRRLAVDHDHATNTVRALLCHRCNVIVWALEDNHTTLAAIRDYIEQWREKFANGPPL